MTVETLIWIAAIVITSPFWVPLAIVLIVIALPILVAPIAIMMVPFIILAEKIKRR